MWGRASETKASNSCNTHDGDDDDEDNDGVYAFMHIVCVGYGTLGTRWNKSSQQNTTNAFLKHGHFGERSYVRAITTSIRTYRALRTHRLRPPLRTHFDEFVHVNKYALVCAVAITYNAHTHSHTHTRTLLSRGGDIIFFLRSCVRSVKNWLNFSLFCVSWCIVVVVVKTRKTGKRGKDEKQKGKYSRIVFIYLYLSRRFYYLCFIRCEFGSFWSLCIVQSAYANISASTKDRKHHMDAANVHRLLDNGAECLPAIPKR